MVKTTSAERMQKLRAKLKEDPEIHEKHLERERERNRMRRNKIKIEGKKSVQFKKSRRRWEAERKRAYRKKKQPESTKISIIETLGSYSCLRTLGKAVSKVKKALPFSPTKKSAVIRKLLYDSCPDTAIRIFPDKENGNRKYNALPDEDAIKIISFYERDDISHQTPGIKDKKSVKHPKTGKRELFQKRYMNMTVREAYGLFLSERPEVKVKLSKFYELRPVHVLLTSDMPHNVCVCKYHANFTYLVEAIYKQDINFPKSSSELLELVCCDIKNEKCMTNKYEDCVTDLKTIISEDVDLDSNINWKEWKEIDKRPKLKELEGFLLEDAIEKLNSQLVRFKTHVYVKRVQSETFTSMKENLKEGDAVLQIDFAENFAIVPQDEIQSSHWSHTQITIFTACAWLSGGEKRSFALVSDCLKHDKYSVFVYLKNILRLLKTEFNLETIKIFSDGAAAQFKNRFIMSNLCYMKEDYGVEGQWYFFASSHGKGAVDGVGAVVKRAVWSRIKQRKFQVENAADFIKAACSSVTRVKIIQVSVKDIEENKEMLDRRWESVFKIKGLQSLHFLQCNSKDSLIIGRTYQSDHDKCRIFKLRVSDIYSEDSTGIDSTDSECSQVENIQVQPPTAKDIIAGTFLLIELKQSSRKIIQRYRYAGIAQSSIDDDGEVKVLFLRIVGNSGKLFKTNESDISYISLEQIVSVLPTPILKNVRSSLFYEFPMAVDVYEQG